MRRILASALVTLALVAPRAARADDIQMFELAKTRFDTGHYEEAAKRFATLLDANAPPCGMGPSDPATTCRLTDVDLIERARAFSVVLLVALGRPAEADLMIEQILLANPAYVPNPATFQPEIIDRFIAMRARTRAQIEENVRNEAEKLRRKRLAAERFRQDELRWIGEIQRLASEERVVEHRSRWVAAMPFGVGQFYNGDTSLGWTLLISQAAAGVAAITSAFVVAGYEGVDVTSPPTASGEASVDIDQLNAQIQTATTVNRIAFGSWAALAIAGIVHAQATFVPERTSVRKRKAPLPPRPTLTPSVSAGPGSLGLGLSGTF